MAKKSRSIDRFTAKKGRLGLTFFFAVTLVTSAHAEVEFLAVHEQHASAGILSAKQWLHSGLAQASRDDWVHAKSQVGFFKRDERWGVGVVRARAGYLSANRNALLLSAQDELLARVDLSAQGAFQLAAKVHTLDSTVFSARWSHALAQGTQLTIESHVHLIHDYQKSEGDFSLQTQGRASRLTGTLRRVGTRDYGFLVDDRVNAGWGWGMDLALASSRDWGDVRLDISNLLNRLEFSSIHFSRRQYDINTSNGEDVVVSEIPSLQGTYGVMQKNEKLPVFWRLRVQPLAVKQATFGLVGLDSDVRWTAAYTLPYRRHSFSFETVQAQNWRVGFEGRLTDQWSVGAGMTGTRWGDPVLSSFYVRGVW
jgi:hypothetical protein